MEIKVLVPEHRKEELEKFIETCIGQGFSVIKQGGGKLPNFSGYYASLYGTNWKCEHLQSKTEAEKKKEAEQKNKAEKWDNLDEEIGKYYEEDFNQEEDDDGLIGIGEAAAKAFGYL